MGRGQVQGGDEGGGIPRAKADPAKVNYVMTELILVILFIYVTMVYGPIAAFLVELFPARIRYTSMSLPYHIGNGWFGGMLPLLATAMVAASGDIYYRLVVSHRRSRDDVCHRHARAQGNEGPQDPRRPLSSFAFPPANQQRGSCCSSEPVHSERILLPVLKPRRNLHPASFDLQSCPAKRSKLYLATDD